MAFKTILVKGTGNCHIEAKASGAITPGQLVARTSATVDTVIRHAVAGGPHGALFAIEDELQGREIEVDYDTATQVQIVAAQRGNVINALIANGQDITKGDYLVSNGDGDLAAVSGDSSAELSDEYPVGVALETIDLSGSSLVDPTSRRCLVEII